MLRRNPFTPGRPLTRGDAFGGRRPQLHRALRLLVLAANGNSRHALITGERGIGKSSVANALQFLAVSDADFVDLAGEDPSGIEVSFLVGQHISQPRQGVSDITRGLIKDLELNAGRARGMTITGVEIDAKLLKFKIGTAEVSTDDAVTNFVDALDDVWKRSGKGRSGIVLVVDELDQVAEQEGMASFFKVLSEQLPRRGLSNVMLVIVGLDNLSDQLAQGHESVRRVFDTIRLDALTHGEVAEVLRHTLLGTGVTITDEAAELIADASGGRPYRVQSLAFEAFEAHEGGAITHDDVRRAIEQIDQT